MTYTAIMAWTAEKRVSKLQTLETEAKAEAHIVLYGDGYPSAFVTATPAEPSTDWLVDPILQTVSVSPVPPPLVTIDDVNAERDRRINLNFSYGANEFQNRPDDRENIQGAYSSALTAIALNGAQVDDLRWSDPDHDFGWIDANNNLVPMDAQTTMAFGNTAKLHKQRLIFAARAIKDDVVAGTITTLDEIATDPRWP